MFLSLLHWLLESMVFGKSIIPCVRIFRLDTNYSNSNMSSFVPLPGREPCKRFHLGLGHIRPSPNQDEAEGGNHSGIIPICPHFTRLVV
jgi:hypothetical protein